MELITKGPIALSHPKGLGNWCTRAVHGFQLMTWNVWRWIDCSRHTIRMQSTIKTY